MRARLRSCLRSWAPLLALGALAVACGGGPEEGIADGPEEAKGIADETEASPIPPEHLANDREFEELSQALESDMPADMRAWAAEKLALFGGERSVPPLLEALHDEEPAVVVSAIRALRGSQDPRVAPALRELLSHPDAGVREAAEEGLEP